MKNQPKKIAVLTSGGDAPGMNAALRAVVRASVFYGIECFAIHQGYQGLIDNEFELMNARSVNNIINKGGTIIKSARCLEFRTPEGRKPMTTLKMQELKHWLLSVEMVPLQGL